MKTVFASLVAVSLVVGFSYAPPLLTDAMAQGKSNSKKSAEGHANAKNDKAKKIASQIAKLDKQMERLAKRRQKLVAELQKEKGKADDKVINPLLGEANQSYEEMAAIVLAGVISQPVLEAAIVQAVQSGTVAGGQVFTGTGTGPAMARDNPDS